MERREFLRGLAAGMFGGTALYLGACATSAPPANAPAPTDAPTEAAQAPAPTEAEPTTQAPAQAQETVEWQMTVSWPSSSEAVFGMPQTVADQVALLSGGRFQIEIAQAGEIVGALEVLDAVQEGTVPIGHTASYYYIGKDMALVFATSLPFGFTPDQQNAWLYHGGGMEALAPIYDQFNVLSFPAGNSGAQMGGWFKREVPTLADLQGLRMRIPGFAGQVMEQLGVVPQTLPAGEIFLALDRGALDAAEWVGPFDDEKLGLPEAANFYYYPAWWEPGPSADCIINRTAWESLSTEFQNILQAACAYSNLYSLARYDALNQAALIRLIEGGVELRPYSDEIMQEAYRISFELYDELAAENEHFGTIYENWRTFREQSNRWFQIGQGSMFKFFEQVSS
ncbi:MAG: ABC transporter substrate-binding protein [Chloroflexaceae bacterium]|nr:ABC transporter substrate-binding protein [Chloroflexaceae bacterium]NJL33138.1 ABC transporter substrate-binding protein [Chloroflexaceae bacterium]